MGLAQKIAQSQNNEESAELLKQFAAFDQALQANSAEGMDTIIQEHASDLGRFHEFRYAVEMRSKNPDLPWTLQALVLKTRRMAEQTVANETLGHGWARATVDVADRLRWEAERLVDSRAASDWSTRAESNLSKSQELYQTAADAAASVQAAISLRNQVLSRIHDLVPLATCLSG